MSFALWQAGLASSCISGVDNPCQFTPIAASTSIVDTLAVG